MNAVTCLTWVRRGVAKSRPDTVRLTDEELAKLLKSGNKSVDADSSNDEDFASDNEGTVTTTITSSKRKRKVHKEGGQEVDSVEARYDLDCYEEDEDEGGDEALSLAGLSFYDGDQHDPYLSKNDPDSDDDSDITISQNDNLIALGKVHDDYFSLEVWVSNAADGTLYCHHDSILSSCPLAMEWVGYDPGEEESAVANMVAVGSMSPDIELWDLDVVNTLEPAFTLKGECKRNKKKNSGKKKVKSSAGHSDAVLGLSWNRNHGKILASASADESVAVWDLCSGEAVAFFCQHSDKVQAVQWHPVEEQLLLSGCYDGCVRLFDCQAPSGSDASRSWSVGGEVEKLLWNHWDPFYAFAGTDSGLLACIDVRLSEPVYTFSAHSSALTSLALSPSIAGCLLTASNDKTVKLWDVRRSDKALLVSERLCKIGAIHCAAACPDEALVFCVGGEREMKVINMKKDTKITDCFAVDEAAVTGHTEISSRPSASSENVVGSCSASLDSSAKKSKKKKKKKLHSKH